MKPNKMSGWRILVRRTIDMRERSAHRQHKLASHTMRNSNTMNRMLHFVILIIYWTKNRHPNRMRSLFFKLNKKMSRIRRTSLFRSTNNACDKSTRQLYVFLFIQIKLRGCKLIRFARRTTIRRHLLIHNPRKSRKPTPHW